MPPQDTLNDDLSQRAVVAADTMSWTETESSSVRRKRLEKDASSPPRVTSVVEYAANSTFPGHRHPLGEEFLVLQGIFSDEHGHYPVGCYVRNPPGSSHTPFSEPGCIILVKLQQMQPGDREAVVIDASAAEGFIDAGFTGVTRKMLFESDAEKVALYRFEPGARVPDHEHQLIEETFVIEGTLTDEHGHYGRWTWIRYPAGSSHTPRSETGCLLYVKQRAA